MGEPHDLHCHAGCCCAAQHKAVPNFSFCSKGRSKCLPGRSSGMNQPRLPSKETGLSLMSSGNMPSDCIGFDFFVNFECSSIGFRPDAREAVLQQLATVL